MFSGRELVREVLAGRPASRPAVGPLAVHFCARSRGVTVRQYTSNASLLAESVLAYWDRFRPDAVWLSADTWVSAQAMGASVGWTGDDQPLGGQGPPLVRSGPDIDRIPPPDPYSQGRYPLMLEALGRVARGLAGRACLVACFDQYPFSLACALMGINEVMVGVRDDPGLVRALMERCLEYGLAYGRALAGAGADLLSGGDSPAGLLGPRGYRDLAWPFEKRLAAGLKETGLPVSLHICGAAGPLLEDMARTGADVLEIDHKADLDQACRQVPEQVALWGNLDPVGLLAQARPEGVAQAAASTLALVRGACRRRFVLSSGCTLPLETPAANLEALVHAAAEFGPWK